MRSHRNALTDALDVTQVDLANKPSKSDQSHGHWKPSQGVQCLTSFLEAASEHLAQIQIVDSVNLDVLTGKAVFLVYTAAVDEARAADADPNKQAVILLLDAAR